MDEPLSEEKDLSLLGAVKLQHSQLLRLIFESAIQRDS